MSIRKKNSLYTFLSGLKQLYNHYFKNYRKELSEFHNTTTVSYPIIIKGARNVSLSEHTFLKSALIMAPKARVVFKHHSGAAEGLTIITGNHDRIVGRFFNSIKAEEKVSEDKDVIVEEDCWMGVNVTILAGVTIKRGTNVAAGAVVTKSTAPYSTVGGVPAKHIKFYWSIEQILEHERLLYPEQERYTRAELEEYFSKYNA